MGDGRPPGRRKGALVLDRELKLQMLAAIIAVNREDLNTAILFRVPFQAVFRVLVVEQPVSLHDVEGGSVGRAEIAVRAFSGRMECVTLSGLQGGRRRAPEPVEGCAPRTPHRDFGAQFALVSLQRSDWLMRSATGEPDA